MLIEMMEDKGNLQQNRGAIEGRGGLFTSCYGDMHGLGPVGHINMF